VYSQLEKLQSLKTGINPKIVNFPVLRLEDVMLTIGTLSDIVNNQYIKSIMNKSGKYVIDKYRIGSFLTLEIMFYNKISKYIILKLFKTA
jgi:hypothetical protein